HIMAQILRDVVPNSGGLTFCDVLHAVPFVWSFLGKQSSLCLRTVSKETRSSHDAACLSLHVHLRQAMSFQKAQLVGQSAILDALAGIRKRGCQPIRVTINADCEATLCAVLQEVANHATRVAIYGSTHLSDRLGATLDAFLPQLQHLVLELSEARAAKGADQVLAAIGNRLRVLELRVGLQGSLPACSLEDCTALEELRLALEMHALAPLGPLRMRGDNAPPAVDAIASLGTHLRCLELVGSSLPRLLDPPHRLAGLSELTALTRLRVDMPPGFLAPQPAEVDAAAADGFTPDPSQLAAAGAQHAAELRWRAVPLAASLNSLVEVHLGRSYELTVYDMRVLARALQLTLLACRNIVLPPTLAHDGGSDISGDSGPVQTPLRPPPVVPFPPQLRELQVRRMPCAPVLAALDALPAPGLQVLKCRALEKAVAAATAAATTTAATAGQSAAAACGMIMAGDARYGGTALPTSMTSATAATGGDVGVKGGGVIKPIRLAQLEAPTSASASSSSTLSSASAAPFVACTSIHLAPSDPGCCRPQGSIRGSGGFKERQPLDDGAFCTARLTEADLAGPDVSVDDLESDSRFPDMAVSDAAAAAAAVRKTVAGWGFLRGGDALGAGVPHVAAEPADTATTAARGAEVHSAASSKKTSRRGGEGLRLALVGSSCAADSIDAGPWVVDVALAACRLIARLLFAYPSPWPSLSPLGAAAAALPVKRTVNLPVLSIRPFERGDGTGGGSGTTAMASTTLRGPHAGSWLAALAPLGSAGLSMLQLRYFEFGTGDLQLLQVAAPELRSCELRDCSVAEEDMRQLQSWLQRPLEAVR
ncbi:hypothetical protein VaNZ11_001951, partial [Volvox africanus]